MAQHSTRKKKSNWVGTLIGLIILVILGATGNLKTRRQVIRDIQQQRHQNHQWVRRAPTPDIRLRPRPADPRPLRSLYESRQRNWQNGQGR